jgi:hypothetical protein
MKIGNGDRRLRGMTSIAVTRAQQGLAACLIVAGHQLRVGIGQCLLYLLLGRAMTGDACC